MELNNHILDGNKHMLEANAELSKANWFFNRINKSKAIESMVKAGDSYALGKDYGLCINSYLDGLKVINNSPDILINFDICKTALGYISMCNKSKIKVNNEIFDLLNSRIVGYLLENKIYNMIVNFYEEIAINYELLDDIELSLKYYQEAINYAEIRKLNTLIIKFCKKMAELNIKNNKYIVGSKHYRECGELCLKSDLLWANAKVYLLYSLILKIEEYSEEQMKEKIIEFTNLDPKLANSPEYNLINGLVSAYKLKNIAHFNQVIVNNKPNFDSHIIQVLEKIKNNIANE